MTPLELVTFIISAPFAVAIGAYLGRKAQKRFWRHDLPYEERVRLLNK